MVDEFTREALAIRVARRLTLSDVIGVLADLFLTHGRPAPIRSDQGPELIAAAVKAWIAGVGARTAYIEQASLCRPQSRSLRSARRRPAPRRAPAASPPAGVERLARPTGVNERRELVEQRLASHRETLRIQGLP